MNNNSRGWKDDRFLLRIVSGISGILSNLLPFLSTGLCSHCSHTLSNRVKSLDPDVANDLSLMVPAVSPRAQEDEVHESIDGDSQSGQGKVKVQQKPELSTDQREYICFRNVQRKKDFICLERVNGKNVNILDGLELHTCVFNAVEQKRIVDFVYMLQKMGMKGEFKERTYTAPEKWMKGKGRVTLQFGCCYNYAKDKNGNPPGILQNEIVDPIPDLFKGMIRRLVRWHVLPPSCVPDSCIVNIYDEGDCIPPHIDSHHFVRPFCTVSFVSECNILFGSSLKVEGPGEFSGSKAILLPVGSVLVLNGNGADVAKHCVPAVPMKRISITFRKMDESKRPLEFILEPDLEGLQPLSYEPERSKGNPTRHRTTGCLRDKEAHQDTSSQGLVVGTKTRPQSSKVPSFANSRGIAENECSYCHKKGHWKRKCPLKRK